MSALLEPFCPSGASMVEIVLLKFPIDWWKQEELPYWLPSTCEKTYWVPSSDAFPLEGAGWFSLQMSGTVRVSTAKSWRDPDWAVMSCTHLAELRRWGTESERVPASMKLHMPSVDWSTESSLTCYRRMITNKHSTRQVFLDNGESFVYWRKCCAKASWTLLLFVHCVAFFFLGFISRLRCVGPCLTLLLKTNATIPMTTASVERPFSKLKLQTVDRNPAQNVGKEGLPVFCCSIKGISQLTITRSMTYTNTHTYTLFFPKSFDLGNREPRRRALFFSGLSVIRLGGHAHLWCQKLHIFKTACNG